MEKLETLDELLELGDGYGYMNSPMSKGWLEGWAIGLDSCDMLADGLLDKFLEFVSNKSIICSSEIQTRVADKIHNIDGLSASEKLAVATARLCSPKRGVLVNSSGDTFNLDSVELWDDNDDSPIALNI